MSATATGATALVFCSESVLLRKLPRPRTSLEDAPAEQLQRIHFSYVTSLSQVRRCLGALDGRPAVIIVEDDGLDDAADVCGWVKTLGVLDMAVRWLRSSAGASQADSRFVFVSNVFQGGRASSVLPFCQHAVMVSVAAPDRLEVQLPFGVPLA